MERKVYTEFQCISHSSRTCWLVITVWAGNLSVVRRPFTSMQLHEDNMLAYSYTYIRSRKTRIPVVENNRCAIYRLRYCVHCAVAPNICCVVQPLAPPYVMSIYGLQRVCLHRTCRRRRLRWRMHIESVFEQEGGYLEVKLPRNLETAGGSVIALPYQGTPVGLKIKFRRFCICTVVCSSALSQMSLI